MHLIAYVGCMYTLSDGYKSRYRLDTQYAKVGLRPTRGGGGGGGQLCLGKNVRHGTAVTTPLKRGH